jgi:hypothetical protein
MTRRPSPACPSPEIHHEHRQRDEVRLHLYRLHRRELHLWLPDAGCREVVLRVRLPAGAAVPVRAEGLMAQSIRCDATRPADRTRDLRSLQRAIDHSALMGTLR